MHDPPNRDFMAWLGLPPSTLAWPSTLARTSTSDRSPVAAPAGCS
jgi:hypothetical protein